MHHKIDIHVHVVQQRTEVDFGNPMDPQSHYICEAEEMMQTLKSQGIGNAILMSSGESFYEGVHSLRAYNTDCFTIAQNSNGFFRWMCGINPINPETIEQRMAACKKMGAVGVGEVMVNQWMDSVYMSALFSAAEKLELPVLCHMSPDVGFSYGVADYPGLPLLEQTLQRYPNLKYIGHSQVFWMEISADCPRKGDEARNGFGQGTVVQTGTVERLLSQYPNLYADLSAYSGSCAIKRDRAYGIYFLEKFQNQLLFGTDTTNKRTIFPLASYLDELHSNGELSQSAYEKICYRNAQKLFHMKEKNA